MAARERILSLLKQTGGASGAFLAGKLKVSRQAVHKHLRALVESGMVVRIGATRNAVFLLAEEGRRPAPPAFEQNLALRGLEEDRVLSVLSLRMGLGRVLNRNAYPVFQYVFTEMLNNAIEHSRSAKAVVRAQLSERGIECTVRDFGVGIFETIQRKFHLAGEAEAMVELLKGKRTTMPARHSGEGIFFSSKACDRLSLRSHGYLLTFDNSLHDVFSAQGRFMKGTEATFVVNRSMKRTLKSVFDRFAKEEFDYSFSTTEVKVKLLATAYISRSEAKRLLAGLEKFKEIVLDFGGVQSIGQGFADEVFRVFPRAHPGIRIASSHAVPAVEVMIRHVVDKTQSPAG